MPEVPALGLARPLAPVGRVHIDPLVGFGVNPTTGGATGRKRERERLTQYHSKFEIAVERRSWYRFPLHNGIICRDKIRRIDLDHARGGLKETPAIWRNAGVRMKLTDWDYI